MRCRKCTQNAVINMRQHKLALCKEHYLDWFTQQTQRSIRKSLLFDPVERILVAVSGGKDSLALWDVLHTLGYEADGLYINLGINSHTPYWFCKPYLEQFQGSFFFHNSLTDNSITAEIFRSGTVDDLRLCGH